MPKLIIQLTERMTVEVEDDDVKAMIKEAAFWGDIPDKCPVCGAAIKFTYREPKKIYKYYGVACEGTPSHKVDLGEHLDGGRLYYKQRAPWVSYTNDSSAIHDSDAQEGREPAAEHDRPQEEPFVMPMSDEELTRQINEKWDERPRSMSIEEAIEKRFSTTLDKLPIVKKQEVLESLMKQ